MSLSKTATNNRPEVVQLISSNQQEIVEMGIDIAALPQILDRLTDLYPYPIESSVREVVSNAYDATVLLPDSERKPIVISSPTALNTMFVVQDFGIGMSLETVKKVYAQYGASTKKTDFRQIGAYGLGAKAPLSYCTEFFGETTHEGITTSFKVSRETKGNFTTILSSEPSDKPNGTTITIPAKEADAQKFRAATSVYAKFGFEVDFVIDGKVPTKAEYRLVTDSFVLDEEANLEARVWIRMDGFANTFYQTLFGGDPEWQYSLSGWVYAASAHDRSGSGAQVQPYLVELKPGVVEFSSSRDEITANDRSTALHGRVREYLQSKVALDKLLEIYRELTDREAMEIFQALVLNHSKITDTEITFGGNGYQNYNRGYNNHNWRQRQRQATGSKTIARKQFVTNSGYDPTEFYFAKQERIVLGGIVLDPVASNIEGLVFERLHNYQGYLINGDYMENMTKIISTKTAGIYSLAELVAQLRHNQTASYRNMHRRANSSTKLLVMTGTPKERVKQSLTWRKTLASIDEYAYALMVYVDDAEKAKEQVAFVEKHAPGIVMIKSYEELKAKVKEIRDSRIKKKDSETITVTVWNDGDSDLEKVVRGFSPRRRTNNYGLRSFEKVSIQDIKDKKAVLVITEGYDATAALIGAANKGVKIADRPIYHVNAGNMLKVKELQKFADYDFLLFGKDYKAKSKLAETLVKTKTYYGEILDAQLSKLEDAVLYRMVANAVGGNGTFYKSFAELLKKRDESPELQEILEKIMKLEPHRHATNGKLTDAQIRVAFPNNADSVVAFVAAAEAAKKNEYTSLMYQISQVAFSSYGAYRKDDMPALEFYFGYIRDKYEALGGK